VVAEMETIRFGLSKNASTNDNKHRENIALEALTGNIDGFLATRLKNYSTDDASGLSAYLHFVQLSQAGAFEIVYESLKGAYDEESMGKALRLLPGL
ncbi:hypothetical protein Tco_1385772, partial [Tanacetum coccineum]